MKTVEEEPKIDAKARELGLFGWVTQSFPTVLGSP